MAWRSDGAVVAKLRGGCAAGWRVLLGAALGVGACAGEAAPPIGGEEAVGEAQLALTTWHFREATRADYTLRLIDLEATPPAPYAELTTTSLEPDGRVLEPLLCRAGGGEGRWTQVEVLVTLDFSPLMSATATAEARTAFRCGLDGVTPVDLELEPVVGVWERCDGFIDCGRSSGGTQCVGKFDAKAAEDAADCAGEACGGDDLTFYLMSACETESGSAPRFWTCGASMAWAFSTGGGGAKARGAFTGGEEDGAWTWGIVALDPDLGVGAAGAQGPGERRVWRGAVPMRAQLERAEGAIVRWELAWGATRVAAVLGEGAGEVLVLAGDDGGDVVATFQGAVGPCDRAVEGTARFEGYTLADVVPEGASAVALLLAERSTKLITARAECALASDAEGAPAVRCQPAEPLR